MSGVLPLIMMTKSQKGDFGRVQQSKNSFVHARKDKE
jgi:hypothetical protein